MTPSLTGSVGTEPADNNGIDVTLIQVFLTAWLLSIKSQQIGILATWRPGIYDDTLGQMITFFQRRRTLPVADGRVDRNGRTWREMLVVVKTLTGFDLPGWVDPPAPKPAKPRFTDLKVLRFQQILPKTGASKIERPSIEPASFIPYLFRPVPPTAALVQGKSDGEMHEFRFKIEKGGAVFWVGAAVPKGTTDFSRMYVFFHPDTMGGETPNYAEFVGQRWSDATRYVQQMGSQMAMIKKIPVVVPFMTSDSAANTAKTNLFGDHGQETLNDLAAAMQISVGNTGAFPKVKDVGVASFSSGVHHLVRFAKKLGPSGLIREQIDFDGPFDKRPHDAPSTLQNCTNWTVTQEPAPFGKRSGWIYLPPKTAFTSVREQNTIHGKIGHLTFRSLMTVSAMR